MSETYGFPDTWETTLKEGTCLFIGQCTRETTEPKASYSMEGIDTLCICLTDQTGRSKVKQKLKVEEVSWGRGTEREAAAAEVRS